MMTGWSGSGSQTTLRWIAVGPRRTKRVGCSPGGALPVSLRHLCLRFEVLLGRLRWQQGGLVRDLTNLSAADVSFILAKNCSPNSFLFIGDESKAFLAMKVSIGVIRARHALEI